MMEDESKKAKSLLAQAADKIEARWNEQGLVVKPPIRPTKSRVVFPIRRIFDRPE